MRRSAKEAEKMRLNEGDETYIPEFGAISRFGDIMVPLAMSAQVQDLVLDALFSVLVQFADIMFESLPLCLFAGILKGVVRRVGLLDEAKVFLCLIICFVSIMGTLEENHNYAIRMRAYIFKGISVGIGKTLFEDVWQDAKLIFCVWRR